MNPSRRTLLLAAAGAAPLAWSARVVAGDYPSRPVRLIVPFAAGGGPDVLARQMLPGLSARLKATCFVENKVGAGGLLAAEHAAQQQADGHHLLLASVAHLAQKILRPGAAYDPIRSFDHVTRLSRAPSLLVVSAESPYRDFADLAKALRAQPDRHFYGSGGLGSPAHLAGVALLATMGLGVTHVPYRGSVELPGALAAGDISFAVPTASTVVPLLGAGRGRLRALASTAALREPPFDHLPTLKELLDSELLVLESWSGIWSPAGTPGSVADHLFETFRELMAEAGVRQAHRAAGVTVDPSPSRAEFSAFVRSEQAKLAQICAAAGIRGT